MIIIGAAEVVSISEFADAREAPELPRVAKRPDHMHRPRLRTATRAVVFMTTLMLPGFVEATPSPGVDPLAVHGAATATGAATISAPSTTSDLQAEFDRLSEEWRRDTKYMSSLTEMFDHPAYVRIIELGRTVVPLLLQELAERPDHWGFALWKITGENPVPADARGNVAGIARAWVQWGRIHQLI